MVVYQVFDSRYNGYSTDELFFVRAKIISSHVSS